MDESLKKQMNLKVPSIYKHFKGNYYMIVGISLPITSDEVGEFDNVLNDKKEKIYYSKFTEEDNRQIFSIQIIRKNGGIPDKYMYHNKEVCNEILVIYRNIKSHEYWARPIEMFCSKVDTEKYPNANQEFRFEEVEL